MCPTSKDFTAGATHRHDTYGAASLNESTKLMTFKRTLAAATVLFAGVALAQGVPEEIGNAVDAANESGVVDTLVSGGDVTVFVPTNDALAAAPQDALTDLLGDSEKLAAVISGYAVEGKVMASDVMDMAGEEPAEVTTLGGGTLMIMVDGDTVMVGPSEDNMATVTQTDLEIGNVTVHTIDTAFLPQ